MATLAIQRAEDGIAVIAVNVPDHRQNVITREFLADLACALDDLQRDPPRGLILQSAKPGSFFAGADLARLDALADTSASDIQAFCETGKKLFSRLSSSCPSVAVIDGTCLGGGLELALACDFRVATTARHTSLGFPEVKLGVLPGWGGTVRTPRLIGPGPAIELVASGEPVDADAALRLGLVDACVPAEVALVLALTVMLAVPTLILIGTIASALLVAARGGAILTAIIGAIKNR